MVRLPFQIGAKTAQFALAPLQRGRILVIERALPGRDLGDGLLERRFGIVPAVFLAMVFTSALTIISRRTRAAFIKAVWFPREPTGAFVTPPLAIRAAFVAGGQLSLCDRVATAHAIVAAPAPLPIVTAQVQAQLLFRCTGGFTGAGVARARGVVPPLGLEDRMPPIVGWTLAVGRPEVGALRSVVGTETRVPPIVPTAIVMAPVDIMASALWFSIVGAEGRTCPIVPAAIVIALGGVKAWALVSIVEAEARAAVIVPIAIVIAPCVGLLAILFRFVGVSRQTIIASAIAKTPVALIGVPAARPIIEAAAAAPEIAGLAPEIGGRRGVLNVSRFDHAVEPLADRHAGSTRGGARSLARLWMKTSQIPRTARFHSYVHIT